ncbi:MAG: DNA-binding response regulator [Hahellaceae bacterium]|nr:DNA-binding response regulator [Hahellaceae bacterium]MCP5169059.1 DNA-binding response regulator [Hahellaceae bacterium]
MSRKQQVLVWTAEQQASVISKLSERFDIEAKNSFLGGSVLSALEEKALLLVDSSIGLEELIGLLDQLRQEIGDDGVHVPIVVLAMQPDAELRQLLFDKGVDDVVSNDLPYDEIVTRIDKSIFHCIATSQLQSRLKMANEMAFMAMADTSDLGVNVHFLLDSNDCTNLDQLGQLLFQALKSYGLICSLQMRSRYDTKNMEPTGLMKDLEAQLITELKDKGRYYDFGRRSVMNYDQVSLLVKNMPVNDSKKYGAIKDNVFSLLQGVNARIIALDNLRSLEDERELMELLAKRMQEIFVDIDESYKELVKNIATVVDRMAEQVDASIMSLGLTEMQEQTLERIFEDGIAETSRLFGDGLKMDDNLTLIIGKMNAIFEFKDRPDFYRYLEKLKEKIH